MHVYHTNHTKLCRVTLTPTGTLSTYVIIILRILTFMPNTWNREGHSFTVFVFLIHSSFAGKGDQNKNNHFSNNKTTTK